MTCKHCGKSNKANKKFCTRCNSRLDTMEEVNIALEKENYESDEGFSRPDSHYIEPKVMGSGENYLYHSLDGNTQQEAEKKQRLSKKSIIGLALALVIVAASLLYFNRNDREGDFALKSSDAIEVYVNQNKFITYTYVFNTKGDILHKIVKATYPIYTPDHTAVVLMTLNSTNSYYVDSNHMIELRDRVNACNISADGKYILYTTTDEMNDSFLYLYDVENQKEDLIDHSNNKRFDMFNILPGGKTITYVTYNLHLESTTSTINDFESYLIKDGGEPELIGKDIVTIAISEDGKNIYSYDYKANILNVKHEENEIHLSSKISNMVFLNRDLSEIVFNDGDATYISIDGNERLKIADTQVDYVLTPKRGISNKRQSNSIMLYGIESFRNKVILCKDKSLILITDKYKTKKIGIVSYDPFPIKPVTTISEDGNDLLYLDSDKNLIKVRNLSGKCSQQTLALLVDSFVAAGDLSQVYYSSGNKLYYSKGKAEPVLVSDNATDLCINQTGDTAYFLENYTGGKGSLFQSNNGSKAEPVSGGESVISINEWNNGIIYQKTIKEIMYVFYNPRGMEFNLLVDGVYFEE